METDIIKKEPMVLTNLDFASIQSMGEAFEKSELFPDIKSKAQAIVKIIAGQELLLPPVYSMQNFYIIKGRLSMAAETMGLLLKRGGKYNYRVVEHTDDKCAIQFYENGNEVYLSTFTIADAKRAGLVRADGNWVKYPRAMLFSRSMSQGAKIVAPELLGDAHTVEEMKDIDQIEESAPEPTKRKTKAKAPEVKAKEEEEEVVIVKRAPTIATSEAGVVLIDGGNIPELVPPGEEPKEEEEEEELKITRDPSSVPTIAKMYKACFDDRGVQPAEVMKLLNIKANSDIIETPWSCYKTVFKRTSKAHSQKEETK